MSPIPRWKLQRSPSNSSRRASAIWKRDYVTKKDEYRELGHQAEYWIVDRFSRTMTVHRNTPEGATEFVISEGEIYRTPLLPGFELPLSELLEAADAWNDPA